MGTLGIRVAVNPWEWMTLQSAAFQGNVFAQNINRHGFKWDLNPDLGYFWINELQARWNQGEDTNTLPGQAKFGAWFQTADLADPFFDEAGIPLADERSSGRRLRICAVDQWRAENIGTRRLARSRRRDGS
jgi:porin